MQLRTKPPTSSMFALTRRSVTPSSWSLGGTESRYRRSLNSLRFSSSSSQIVLDGFELNTDTVVVRYPDRYMDERGKTMWDRVMTLLDQTDVESVGDGTAACCRDNNTLSDAPDPVIR